ncbi:phosphatidate cytidylyltransferase [Bacillus sp. MUM 13]|uniref:phosphatidate cytidylyltransferase n=1 Tax=Bacillus sp. MUM 13 TaxID=1678001 RepID=UPI0008F5A10B|nr:phosphatidate cytidylyltransferase [Bacillus sp. MUM 13]OIK15313.1 phosphatidate cytidylyltransferase [Bacillus sp. MUM 13]
MKQRIITAVIAAAIFIPLVVLGNLPFLLLIYLMATIGFYELLKMKKMPLSSFSSLLSFILLWAALVPEQHGGIFGYIYQHKLQIFLLGVLIYLIYTVVTKNSFTFDDAGFLSISVLYVGMGFYYMFETRQEGTNGLYYLFYALFTIWATDSGAYFFGKAMGKRKLWPEISPNKTIEGFVGGIVCALIVAILFYFFSDLEHSAVKLLLISILISVFGQMGDLVQSAYKRHYGVKDSGRLLPGHGGILDRLDSLIFILPILQILNLF